MYHGCVVQWCGYFNGKKHQTQFTGLVCLLSCCLVAWYLTLNYLIIDTDTHASYVFGQSFCSKTFLKIPLPSLTDLYQSCAHIDIDKWLMVVTLQSANYKNFNMCAQAACLSNRFYKFKYFYPAFPFSQYFYLVNPNLE